MSVRGRETIALIGMRCSGKSTVGRELAVALGLAFVDLDAEVVRHGRYAGVRADSVGELLERAGQARFRDLEAGALRRLLESSQRIVLATGGGVVERADNRSWLSRVARCVFLSVPLAQLVARMQADSTHRPALLGGDPVEELGELLRRREPLYRGLAEVVIDCGDAAPSALVARIRAALSDAGPSES